MKQSLYNRFMWQTDCLQSVRHYAHQSCPPVCSLYHLQAACGTWC